MLELRRTQAGIFKEDDKKYPLINLYDFEKAVNDYKNGNEEALRQILIPGEVISQVLPIIHIKPDNLKKLLTGKPIFYSDLIDKDIKIQKEEKIAVFLKDRFIGCYSVLNDGDIFAKAEFVFN